MSIELPIPKGATKPKRPCLVCGKMSTSPYCDKHKNDNPSVRQSNSKKTDPFYLSKRWRETSKAYRKQNPLCEHCEERGRLIPAQCVDHITPRQSGGDDFDWNNLQSLCWACHSRKTAKERTDKKTQVVILSGPPGAGKTTYVKEHIQIGELALDIDMIYQALTFQPAYVKPKEIEDFVFRIRDRIYHMLKEPNDAPKAWIITSYAQAGKRKKLAQHLNAKSILLVPSPEVCKQRIHDQNRSGGYGWNRIIDQWYKDYTTYRGERDITPPGLN